MLGKLWKKLKAKIKPQEEGKRAAAKLFISEWEVDEIVEFHFFNSDYTHLREFDSRVSYWQAVVKAIIKAESDFNIISTFWEKDLGNNGYDKVTGRKYLSEGLMQLSYSDARYYDACEFDWDLDKNKDENDVTKTIFTPTRNIGCGLAILNSMVRRNGTFIYDKGNYWAVLKPSNKRHKVFQAALQNYLLQVK